MAIIRRSDSLLPSVFNDFFGNEWIESSVKSTPAVNIQQNDSGFLVEVAAPGMTKDDCLVKLNDKNNLVISFEKKYESDENKNRSYLRREFYYSKFQRTLILPDNIDKENISAKVNNGVLSVVIPTIIEPEKVTEKLIEIK